MVLHGNSWRGVLILCVATVSLGADAVWSKIFKPDNSKASSDWNSNARLWHHGAPGNNAEKGAEAIRNVPLLPLLESIWIEERVWDCNNKFAWVLEQDVRSSSTKSRGGQVSKIVEIHGLGIHCSSFQGSFDCMGADSAEKSQPSLSALTDAGGYDYMLVPFDLSLLVIKSGKLEHDAPQYSITAELTQLVVESLSLGCKLVVNPKVPPALGSIRVGVGVIAVCYMLILLLSKGWYGRYRPLGCPLSKKSKGWPKIWWLYAQESVLYDVRKKLKKISWRYLGQRLYSRRDRWEDEEKFYEWRHMILQWLGQGKQGNEGLLPFLPPFPAFEKCGCVLAPVSFSICLRSSFQEFIHRRRKYVNLYKVKLDLLRKEQPLDQDVLFELELMEKDSDIDDILQFRAIAERELEDSLKSTFPEVMDSSASGGDKLPNDEAASGKARGWLNWLSRGVLGAGGTEDSSQFSGVVSDEVIKDICEATKFQPVSSVQLATSGTMFLFALNFSIKQISLFMNSSYGFYAFFCWTM
ncbi:hypothetical protein Cgig2_004811 [Carnegiea gigantea]|uniref:Uncharacterized protein n=1 Tax=Carnegiea gigantea TaxID=171969 RepID=A0A9Q1KWT9_9CARY|nr:hypothetical protein Cgig2_004811 [Carnegiea gigantea]